MTQYYCPRCGNTKIIDFADSFDCPVCQLEFEKKDFDTIKDKSKILSIEEKLGVTRELRKDRNIQK